MHFLQSIGVFAFLSLMKVERVAAQPISNKIKLFEKLPGMPNNDLTPCAGALNTFFFYFNALWPWLIGTAAGLAVLMGVVGGLQVILSGGDPGKRQEGTGRLMQALLGLLLLSFAGLILRVLNPSFFLPGDVGTGCPT